MRFQLSANGTVLVENYTNPALPGGGHMMTAYHIDGQDLMLTHCCIANNQPTLRAERFDPADREIQFEFNEGYAARTGDDLVRVDLCGEAIRLARLVVGNATSAAPEAHALLSLMAFQAARLHSRVDDQGEIILLEDQDRGLWDASLIALGFTHLEQSAQGAQMSRYHVQAAIAAAHASASTADDTPWDAILCLYDDLIALNPSPLISLNRVVAVWKARGVDQALSALAALERNRRSAVTTCCPP